MLQEANTDLYNPLVPIAQNTERKKLLFPLQIRPVKVNFKKNWRIFILLTLGANGLSEFMGGGLFF